MNNTFWEEKQAINNETQLMSKSPRMLEFGKYDGKLEQGMESQGSWGKRSFSFKQDGQVCPHCQSGR